MLYSQKYIKNLKKLSVSCAFSALVIVSGFSVAYADDAATKNAINKIDNLSSVLSHVYETNPVLQTQRKSFEAARFDVPLAKSNFRPSINLEATQDFSRIERQNQREDVAPQRAQINVIQPLYRGGRTTADVSQAYNNVAASTADLYIAEQDILFDAVTAYFDLEQAFATLKVRQKNVNVLSEQYKATKDRFDVGELTRTDVSQAKSRFEGSRAEKIDAEASVKAAIATYQEIVDPSIDADVLMKEKSDFRDDVAIVLPAMVSEALETSLDNHPRILLSQFQNRAATDGIDSAFGALLPELNIQGNLATSRKSVNSFADADEATIGVRLSVPLYQGGALRATLAQSQATADATQYALDTAVRDVRQDIILNWNSFQSSKAQINAINAQIKSASIALEGVRLEEESGSRTILDVLDAEQEFFDAELALVSAERNLAIAKYGLLRAMGDLTHQGIGLDGSVYNPIERLEAVESDWFSFE